MIKNYYNIKFYRMVEGYDPTKELDPYEKIVLDAYVKKAREQENKIAFQMFQETDIYKQFHEQKKKKEKPKLLFTVEEPSNEEQVQYNSREFVRSLQSENQLFKKWLKDKFEKD